MCSMTLARPRLSAALVTAPVTPEFAEILTPRALEFLARLQRRFNTQRRELLARRRQLQERLDEGDVPDFCRGDAAFVRATGASSTFRPTCLTAASRSPGRSIARW